MKTFGSLTKIGIVLFVLVTGMAGYCLSHGLGQEFELSRILLLLLGLYFVSSGSFALNQGQEWRLDQAMPRTKERPVASGHLQPWQAYMVGAIFCVMGLALLYLLEPMCGHAALFTVIMYNGLYTLYWKKKWVFGAVPGAIPGAMPVVIGFVANRPDRLLSPECFYLFLIMFLWQMPHFWALALRYREDYRMGGVPVLPVALGRRATLFQIGLYTFTYVGVALAAPLFLNVKWLYLLLVFPFAAKVLYEFFKYFRSESEKAWLPFFLWVNLSVLVFLMCPVLERFLLTANLRFVPF